MADQQLLAEFSRVSGGTSHGGGEGRGFGKGEGDLELLGAIPLLTPKPHQQPVLALSSIQMGSIQTQHGSLLELDAGSSPGG